eukprot:scaffold65823_cov40-Cyclotella_meneghiniana.AAC.5
MDKTNNNTLTNQPETVTILSPILLRVMGCWDAGKWGQRLNFLRDHTCTDMRSNFFGSKMYKSDPITLTNQPETRSISPSPSRVMGCWGVGAEAEFVENQPAEMDKSEIFVFGGDGDGGAKSAKSEAAMTPAVSRMKALGPGGVVAAGGRSKSQ